MEKTKNDEKRQGWNRAKVPCPDCGNAEVNHTLEKMDVIVQELIQPFEHIGIRLKSGIEKIIPAQIKQLIVSRIVLPGLYFLDFVHIGSIKKAPDDEVGSRAKAFWLEGQKRGIDMWEFRLFGRNHEFFIAHISAPKLDRTILFEGLPRPTPSPALSWMDNKSIMRKKFAEVGIPVAGGDTVRNWQQAQLLFQHLHKPVIIKPHIGSRSRHTTTHIVHETDFKVAFTKAKQLSPWIVVEEELSGLVHRATMIGGKVAGVLRREPPCVTGDGIHTIEELIKAENHNPLRKGPIFHEINIGDETLIELAQQKMTLSSVPKQGHIVTLAQKASRGLGGGATDMTDTTHPDNIALFEKVATTLHDPLVGIDFIIDDISISWKKQPRAGVIECNSMPFIDLHLYPLVGTPRNTAGALWDLFM